MKKRSTQAIVLVAILGAWSFILRLFDFPLLPAAPFLKVDFSDLMVLIGLLVKGPWGMFWVAFIRDLINYLVKGGEAGLPIGFIMSLTASLAMFIGTHLILKRGYTFKKLKTKIYVSTLLIINLTIILVLLNYFITLPIYVNVLKFPIDNFVLFVITIVVPFNVLKGIIIAAGQILIISKITPLLKHKKWLYPTYYRAFMN